MSTRPGRPKAAAAALSKPRILAAARAILDQDGVEGVTFRALAKRLGVTAMAVTHHTGPHAALIADLAAEVYRPLGAPLPDGPAEDRLRHLLLRYAATMRTAPSLTLHVFATPALYAGPLAEMTAQVAALAADMGAADPDRVSHVLIDHLHGAALAAAHAPDGARETAWQDLVLGVDWLLARIVDA